MTLINILKSESQKEQDKEFDLVIHRFRSKDIDKKDLEIKVKGAANCSPCNFDESVKQLKANSILFVLNQSEDIEKDLDKLTRCKLNLGNYFSK